MIVLVQVITFESIRIAIDKIKSVIQLIKRYFCFGKKRRALFLCMRNAHCDDRIGSQNDSQRNLSATNSYRNIIQSNR